MASLSLLLFRFVVWGTLASFITFASSRPPALLCRHRAETISFTAPQAAIRLPDVDVRQKIDSLKMLAPSSAAPFVAFRCCCSIKKFSGTTVFALVTSCALVYCLLVSAPPRICRKCMIWFSGDARNVFLSTAEPRLGACCSR